MQEDDQDEEEEEVDEDCVTEQEAVGDRSLYPGCCSRCSLWQPEDAVQKMSAVPDLLPLRWASAR